jgi:hypothetical protein
MHREDRHRCFQLIPFHFVRRQQLEDEEVKTILFPRVHRPAARDLVSYSVVLRRALNRSEKSGVRARQVFARRMLTHDALMQIGRTGRLGIPSATFLGLDVERPH